MVIIRFLSSINFVSSILKASSTDRKLLESLTKVLSAKAIITGKIMLNKKNRDFTILGMFNLSLAVYNKSESNFIWLSSVPPCLSMQYLEKTTTNNKLIYL